MTASCTPRTLKVNIRRGWPSQMAVVAMRPGPQPARAKIVWLCELGKSTPIDFPLTQTSHWRLTARDQSEFHRSTSALRFCLFKYTARGLSAAAAPVYMKSSTAMNPLQTDLIAFPD
jgi:hypothetical protein